MTKLFVILRVYAASFWEKAEFVVLFRMQIMFVSGVTRNYMKVVLFQGYFSEMSF